MADNQRSKVTADIKRNRLTITISSTASKKEADKIYTDIRFCVADLKPGFDIITDFSHCTLAHLSAIPTMRKIMDYLVNSKPENVIRVVGKTSLVFKQLLRFTNRFQSYKPLYVNTLEEAEKILANSTRHNGLCFNKHRQLVDYKINQEEGKGHLIEISTSGCKVQGLTLPLSADKEISIVIPFHQEDHTPSSLTFSAKVVQAQDDLFMAHFLDIDDDQKAQLYKCLACEARQDIPPE